MKNLVTSIFILLFTANIVIAETVVFNVKTHKYHKTTCSSAIKCTKNCIKIDKQQAKAKGGVPCKVCGG